MVDRQTNTHIEEWGQTHSRLEELLSFVKHQGQLDWFNFNAAWHLSTHVLVSLRGSELVGFLRFVVQSIGPDADCPPVQYQGADLLEAKVIAFAVSETRRAQGIGRRLQEALIERARTLNCHQIRSHSGGQNAANHQLKLSMGYGVHPIIRGDDHQGVYFVLPLLRS